MKEKIYKARYENGCMVVEVDGGRLEICGDGEIKNSVEAGVYKVDGLYNSLCQYFQNNTPKDLKVILLNKSNFVVGGDRFVVSSDKNRVVVEAGNFEVEVNEKEVNLGYRGVLLYEKGWLDPGLFINRAFAGEICKNADVSAVGSDLVFKTRWGEFLRVGKNGSVVSADFCLVFGGIENPEEICEWAGRVAQAMVYKGMGKGFLGADVYVFKWGLWKIGLTTKGKLNKIRFADKNVKIEITDTAFLVKRKGERKRIELEGAVKKTIKISEIFLENNEFLRLYFFR